MEEKILCRDCIYWEYQSGTQKGICRKYAPSPAIMESRKEYTIVLPSTMEEDVCFEGKSRS